jgi:PiT family inorganic phosphate transporter
MIFLAPMVGFGIGYMIMKLLKLAARHLDTRANEAFKRMQIINMILLSYSHSTHDSQKSIGIILLLMAIAGHPVEAGAYPPFLAVLAASLCMSLGIIFGGYSIIRTVGTGIYKVRPIHSFASQLTATSVLLTANALRVPVSASHVVSSSIMGVGSAERINAVRWSKVRSVIISWFITLPIVGTLGALLYFLFSLFLVK